MTSVTHARAAPERLKRGVVVAGLGRAVGARDGEGCSVSSRGSPVAYTSSSAASAAAASASGSVSRSGLPTASRLAAEREPAPVGEAHDVIGPGEHGDRDGRLHDRRLEARALRGQGAARAERRDAVREVVAESTRRRTAASSNASVSSA